MNVAKSPKSKKQAETKTSENIVKESAIQPESGPSRFPIAIEISPPCSSDTETDDDVFEPERDSDLQPAKTP